MLKSSLSNQPGFVAMIMELVLLTVCMLAIPAAVAIDVLVFNHGLKEVSLTEFSQSVLLLVSMVCIGMAAWRNTVSRGLMVLVAGLFAAMLIRETDKFLDTISQGFWVYPAVIVSAVAIVIAVRLRGTLIKSMVDFAATRQFTYLAIGLLLVVVFSRAFGSGWFWAKIMGEDFHRLYKTIMQEGLELLGYVLI